MDSHCLGWILNGLGLIVATIAVFMGAKHPMDEPDTRTVWLSLCAIILVIIGTWLAW